MMVRSETTQAGEFFKSRAMGLTPFAPDGCVGRAVGRVGVAYLRRALDGAVD
jgi:hypothetical protein